MKMERAAGEEQALTESEESEVFATTEAGSRCGKGGWGGGTEDGGVSGVTVAGRKEEGPERLKETD